MPKTNTEKSRHTRAKRLKEGLGELRGVWAPKDKHKVIKQYIKGFLASLK